MDKSAVKQAVQAAGGRGVLAAACRVRYQAVQKWESAGVPIDRCPAIERATGGQVRCEDLRPDVIWQREAGEVIGYLVRVSSSHQQPAAPAKAA